MSNTRTGIDILVPRAERWGIEHGPTIENIAFSNIVMDTQQAIFLWIGDDAATPGCIRNISISHVVATTTRACYLGGSKSIPIEGVRISDMKLIVKGNMDNHFAAGVPYPYCVWGYWLTHGLPYGFYCRYVRDLDFQGLSVEWKNVSGPWLSALCMDNVENLSINGMTAGATPGQREAPVIDMSNVRGALLRGCGIQAKTGTFLRVAGALSHGISAVGNDLSLAQNAFHTANDVPINALRQTANILPQP
jgi:hypothetical protein